MKSKEMSTSTANLEASISEAVGGQDVTSRADLDGSSVDGRTPRFYVEPNRPEEMAEILHICDSAGAAVIPRGSGSRLALGNLPAAYDVSISTARLGDVLEYEPGDMTVSVQAGIKLAGLQRVLAGENQFLALDPPFGDRATIGGILAANSSGPLRAGYGTARDQLIGIRVAHPDGVVTKAGGMVVKNVTGYDLNKLYMGSLGTLGVIVEANFKLYPLPAVEKSVLAVFGEAEAAARAVDRLVDSVLMPNSVELLDSNALSRVTEGGAPAGGRALLVKFGGGIEAVDRQVSDLQTICADAAGVDALGGLEQDSLWQSVRELQAGSADRGETLCKISVLSSQVPDVFERARMASESAGLTVALWARAVSGICYASIEGEESDASAIRSVVTSLRAGLGSASATVVESCPPFVKEDFDVWGDSVDPVALDIMKSIKTKFDPGGTLSPGRFVGGI